MGGPYGIRQNIVPLVALSCKLRLERFSDRAENQDRAE